MSPVKNPGTNRFVPPAGSFCFFPPNIGDWISLPMPLLFAYYYTTKRRTVAKAFFPVFGNNMYTLAFSRIQ